MGLSRPWQVLEFGRIGPPGPQVKVGPQGDHSTGVDLIKIEREVTK